VATCYCPTCLNTFTGTPQRCPNLGCGRERPGQGWGRILEPGDLIDRHYRVDRVLALGGAGLTYLCRAVDGAGRPVPPDLAVKVLFAERATGAYLRRLANEAQILQDLDHDHIVRCRGFVQRTGQAPYLVTQFEGGGTLQQHVRQVGPLPLPVAAGVMVQVLQALAIAHSAGVVHRDLKPANVLLHAPCERPTTPWVRVADFGIAKVNAPIGAGLTQAGAFVGTPEYAAPEQYEGLPPQPATDIFASGGLLFFLLTGHPPVDLQVRGDPLACFEQVLEQLPPRLPPDTLPRAEGTALQEVIAQVMQVDPAQRWSIPRIMEALRPSAQAPARPGDGGASRAVPPPEPSAGLAETTLLEPPAAPARALRSATALEAPPLAASPPPAFDLDDATFLDPQPPPAAAPAPQAPATPRDLTLDDLFTRAARPTEVPAPGPAATLAPAPPPAPVTALAPAPAPPSPSPVGSWTPAAPAPLPSPLPATPEALLVLLGAVAPRDRPPVEHALAALPRPEVARALRAWRPGLDPAWGRGAGLVIAVLGGSEFATVARNLLRATEPEVRACACQALGATAQGSLLSTLARALEDPAPEVRAAAALALGEACRRGGDRALGRSWLARLAQDPDETVHAAWAAALTRLEA
jgi:serine/threonine protein kinase